MKNYFLLILTGALATAATLMISYFAWGKKNLVADKKADANSLVTAAAHGQDAVVFVLALPSDTSNLYKNNQAGSGILISPDGYIVTNYHVVAGAKNLHVQTHDRHLHDAQLTGIDSTHDVAVLKIEGKDFSFLEFGNSDSLKIGEQVLAVGNPYRLLFTVTSGIISAKDRELALVHDQKDLYIQTDVPINMGNSGGALLNTRGELIGMNIAMITMSGEYEGFSFAIPSNLVKKIASDLREYGIFQNASIGMMIRPVDEQIAREAGVPEVYGIVVDALTPDGAADQSGIQSLDILLSVNGHRIMSNTDFTHQLELYRPGDVLHLETVRDGKHLQKEVKLREVREE